MNTSSAKAALKEISLIMAENRDYLIQLDQQNGDGDLGISMSEGFAAAAKAMEKSTETDLGRFFMELGEIFNEAAPSSLGTILSIGFMGMAKYLRGKTEADCASLADAMMAGLERIMSKANSKPGEKTILDSLYPAVVTMKTEADKGYKHALQKAAISAADGSEATKNMKSIHGRAAYYTDNSIGILDGGSVVGKLIFDALAKTEETL